LTSITPSGWKGVAENALSRGEPYIDPERGPVTDLIGKDGLPVIDRTDSEWNTRIATGLRPQRETLERDSTWTAKIKQAHDLARQKEIVQEYKRAIINNTIDSKGQKLMDEYIDRKGDPQNLLNLYIEAGKEMNQTQKQRMEGIPSTTQGVNRFNYFNK
jgi:hypothetical protein